MDLFGDQPQLGEQDIEPLRHGAAVASVGAYVLGLGDQAVEGDRGVGDHFLAEFVAERVLAGTHAFECARIPGAGYPGNIIARVGGRWALTYMALTGTDFNPSCCHSLTITGR